MISIKSFTFNPFAENTYIISDSNSNAIVIDPGMYDSSEQHLFQQYLKANKLNVGRILLTHAHLDHVFGLKWASELFELAPSLYKEEEMIYVNAQASAMMYGVNLESLPKPRYDINPGTHVKLGEIDLEVRFTPGHSPGSVCYINHETESIIGGDVLFNGSIGRSDLPGGNHDQLINSINSELMELPDNYKVYSGHGPLTTIGHEKRSNPFLNN